MRDALASFPSDPLELWDQHLGYFTFAATGAPLENGSSESRSFDELIHQGVIRLIPQQYEDFFGPAATNIFNSNIGLEDVSNVGIAKPDSQQTFEAALGREVINMYDYYDHIQEGSRKAVCAKLGLADAPG